MDFALTPELLELQQRTRGFIRDKIIPLEGDPRQLPAAHGKATLEELFIAVAREPLTLGAP